MVIVLEYGISSGREEIGKVLRWDASSPISVFWHSSGSGEAKGARDARDVSGMRSGRTACGSNGNGRRNRGHAHEVVRVVGKW